MQQADSRVRVDLVSARKRFTELLAAREYDIVLADYRLPGWTGMDALREMRRLGFDTPLILITGALGDERAVECVKAGAADYVLKDASLARLPLAVKRALEEKHARDESQRAQTLMEVAQRTALEREERDMTERRALEDQHRQAQRCSVPSSACERYSRASTTLALAS
jgi:DNA-binding NtrC family response regulator